MFAVCSFCIGGLQGCSLFGENEDNGGNAGLPEDVVNSYTPPEGKRVATFTTCYEDGTVRRDFSFQYDSYGRIKEVNFQSNIGGKNKETTYTFSYGSDYIAIFTEGSDGKQYEQMRAYLDEDGKIIESTHNKSFDNMTFEYDGIGRLTGGNDDDTPFQAKWSQGNLKSTELFMSTTVGYGDISNNTNFDFVAAITEAYYIIEQSMMGEPLFGMFGFLGHRSDNLPASDKYCTWDSVNSFRYEMDADGCPVKIICESGGGFNGSGEDMYHTLTYENQQ